MRGAGDQQACGIAGAGAGGPRLGGNGAPEVKLINVLRAFTDMYGLSFDGQ